VTELNYEEDVAVGKNLDDEWIRQPGLYANWSIKYAEALARKDRIWLDKKVLVAEQYKKVKSDVEMAGKKITDKGIEAEIRSTPEYREVSAKLIDAEEEVNKLDAVKWAMEQKKKSLENLSRDDSVGYHMSSGYSDPTSNTDRAVERKNQQSIEQDVEIRKGLKINRNNRG
jgi:hypothetical protein